MTDSNNNQKSKNLKPFKKGRPKTGGRKKGTPDRLKPEDARNIILEEFVKDMPFTEMDGTITNKMTFRCMFYGVRDRAVYKGDPKAFETALRAAGLWEDKVDLNADVRLSTENVTADTVIGELKQLANAVRKRAASKGK